MFENVLCLAYSDGENDGGVVSPDLLRRLHWITDSALAVRHQNYEAKR